MGAPPVTVILPVYNESAEIDRCLESLAAQDYGGELTIVVAEGGSADDTPQRVAAWGERLAGLAVIPNPDRRQSPGLNRAARAATSEILVRADGHTTYDPDYVRTSVDALEELGRGWAVGGNMRPAGRGTFGRAVAAAMNSRFTMGPARFHHWDRRTEVDTVYLGAFRRDEFLAVGGFRSFPSGAAEDADFYFRWRRSGRRIQLVPGIRSAYRPRERPASLWRQYLRYGQGKAEMLWVNGRFPSWRPLAPLLLVVGLAVCAVLAAAGTWLPGAVLAAAWLAVLAVAAVQAGRLAPLVLVAAAMMHLGYGLGMLWGLARGPRRVRDVRAAAGAGHAPR